MTYEVKRAVSFDIFLKLDENTTLDQLLSILNYYKTEDDGIIEQIKTHYEKITNDAKEVFDRIQKDEVSQDADVYFYAEAVYTQGTRRLNFISNYLELFYEEV